MSEWRTEYTMSILGLTKKTNILNKEFSKTPIKNEKGNVYERVDGNFISLLLEEKKGQFLKLFVTNNILIEVDFQSKTFSIKVNDENIVVLFTNSRKIDVSLMNSYEEFIESLKKRLIHYDKREM